MVSGSKPSNEEHYKPPPHQTNDQGTGPPPAKLWPPNGPLQDSLPALKGDPWKVALEKERKYDREQCEVWKDEIDKVLLFAALFSAIVTAFTIESTKRLEIDNGEAASMLLYVMHRQLDSIARQNITLLPPVIPNPISTFRSPNYAVHVNICWYLSLTLSLTTVVIGILCLQWLREHRRDRSASAEKVVFTRAIRIHALNLWKVPTLVGALPVLLLASLLLFFAGLNILLWNVNQAVAVVSSAAIGATVLVLLATSIIPAINHRCAFRSPQVWVFYYLWRTCSAWFIGLRFFGEFFLASFSATVSAGATLSHREQRRDLLYKISRTWARLLLFWRGAQSPRLKDWLTIDEDTAAVQLYRKGNSADSPTPWQWYTSAFAQDKEAMLAFLGCVEMQELFGATKRRQMLEIMYSSFLCHLLPTRPPTLDLDVIKDDNVTLALCHAYASRLDRALEPYIFDRRLELHLRIINTYSIRTNEIIRYVLEEFTVIIQLSSDLSRRAIASALPEGGHEQIQETLYAAITQRENRTADDIRVCVATMLYLLPHQSSPPTTLVSLNHRLEGAVKASHSATPQALLGNVADYLHCCYRQHEDQFQTWRDTFSSLAREINIKISKPGNQGLRRRVAPRYDGVYGHTRQWHWVDFAREQFGLEPAVHPLVESEATGGPPTPPPNVGSPLLAYNNDSTRNLVD